MSFSLKGMMSVCPVLVYLREEGGDGVRVRRQVRDRPIPAKLTITTSTNGVATSFAGSLKVANETGRLVGAFVCATRCLK